MRDIKFRGRSKLNGKWHFGSLVKGNSEDWDYIIPLNEDLSGDGIDFYSIRIISNTAGEYTGLKDKNGVEIYEGDIFKFGHILNVVEFKNGMFCYSIGFGGDVELSNSHFRWSNSRSSEIEVIGNIHQNQELLNK